MRQILHDVDLQPHRTRYWKTARLDAEFKTRAEKVMFVKGDDNIPFADVANVIDIAHASGVDKVGLITAKIESGG